MEIGNSKNTPVQRLLALIKLEKKDIYLLVALTFGYGILGIATPIAVQTLVNIVTMGGVLQPLFVVSFILFVLLLLSGVLYVFEAYVVELIQRRLFIRTSINAALNAQGIDPAVYDYSNPVELMNRFFDISTLQKSTATLLTVGLAALLQGFIGSVILISYSLYFAIIVAVVLILLAFILFVLGRNAVNTAIDESKAKYATAEWLETIAKNFYVFKFFNGLERAKRLSNHLANNYLKKRQAHFSILLFQKIGAVTLYAIIGTTMLALGGGLVIKGQINLGQFVAAELIIFGVLAAFVRFITKLEDFYSMLAAIDKIGFLDDLPQESIGKYSVYPAGISNMQALNLSFHFSQKVNLINNLGFYLAKGQSIAVLGEPGIGKSTLIKIVAGITQPSTGHIEFDGNDLRQLDQNSLRNVIGIAGRVEVIECSILENIILDRENISLNSINLILSGLGLHDDFYRLENGLDTQLNAFGAPLSTTQLDRLMLARAVVGKPNLLIVDGLLDNLASTELTSVLNLFETYKADWMLMVTTRFEHIANKFDNTISLNQQKSEAK